MAARNTVRLKIVTSGKRHYVNVPSGDANALHQFFLAHNIHATPPQPSSTGMDTIDLRPGSNIETVQALLDKWA